jgi:hypothetical protein
MKYQLAIFTIIVLFSISANCDDNKINSITNLNKSNININKKPEVN